MISASDGGSTALVVSNQRKNIELLGQRRRRAVAEPLRLRPIDDTNEALESLRPQQFIQIFASLSEVEEELFALYLT